MQAQAEPIHCVSEPISPPVLHHAECLATMAAMPAASVDLVLVDPPYGIKACAWDQSIIPLPEMWAAIERVIKRDAFVICTANQPFTSELVASNRKRFLHHWIWDKVRPSGFQIAKVKPMMRHEDVLVFRYGSPRYAPEMTERPRPIRGGKKTILTANVPRVKQITQAKTYTHSYPQSILRVNRDHGLHPTQKPVELMRYMIRTYSRPGATVLDFTMGSGTTGVAAAMEGRAFIGVERDEKYFAIAQRRITEAHAAR